jgi:hypothetical protein
MDAHIFVSASIFFVIIRSYSFAENEMGYLSIIPLLDELVCPVSQIPCLILDYCCNIYSPAFVFIIKLHN